MKNTVITIAALALNCAPMFGATAFESELAQLQAQHARALAAAAEPVNRRQIAALEALQRRATQANDLETAIKIKAELAKLVTATSGTNATSAAGESLSARLVGTKWVWFGSETLTFESDGKAVWNGRREPWPWKVENVGRRVISGQNMVNGKKFTITFDAEFKTGDIAGEDGQRVTRKISN